MRRPAAALAAVAALLLAAPAAAPAQEPSGGVPLLGISDQKPSTFTDPRFAQLNLRFARLVLPWDAIFTDPAAVDRWLGSARRARVVPLIAFSAGTGSRCPTDPCVLPRPEELLAAFDAFRAAYPWVTEFQVWNEVNHESQPTKLRPELTAELFNTLREHCPDCRLVAADLLGDASMRGWIARFRSRVDDEPELWGLHNYRDVNEGTSGATEELLRLVPGQVWFTETGGIVKFTTRDGRVVRPYDEARAAAAVNTALDLGKEHFPRVERIYLYNWRAGAPTDRFDSGIVAFDGRARPAFEALWRRVHGTRPLPEDRAFPPDPVPWDVRTARAGVSLPAVRVESPRGREMTTRVTCRRREDRCLGLLTFSTAALGRLGAGAFSIEPGTTQTVRVTLSRRAAAALRRVRRPQPVVAKLRLRTGDGAAAKTTKRLTLVQRRPR